MTILYVLEHYHPYVGGAEKLFQNIAEEMVRNGHRAIVVTTRFDSDLPRREQYRGVEIYRVPCFNRYLFTFFGTFFLLRFKEPFDFIHSTTYNAALPAWIVGKIKGKPTLLTFHEVWGKLWFQLPFLKWWQRWSFYTFERIVSLLPFSHYIAVSESTRQDLIACGIPSRKISRIYNGIDYSLIQPCPIPSDTNTPFRFLYFGRLGVSKGLNLLLPAFHRLFQEQPNVHLTLVLPKQPNGMLRKIKGLIKNGRGSQKISLMHELSSEQLTRTICASNCVAIPSYTEGFCYVAVESIALNIPVISSNQKALREVVGGKHIKLKAMNEDGLLEAMKKAKEGLWESSPSPRYHLKDSVDGHLQLYDELTRKL